MAKTIEEILADTVAKAIEKELRPLRKEMATIKAAIDMLSKTAETEARPMQLITLTEAKERLLVNSKKLNELIEEGQIKTATTPQGRRKVLESSLDDYIRQAAG